MLIFCCFKVHSGIPKTKSSIKPLRPPYELILAIILPKSDKNVESSFEILLHVKGKAVKTNRLTSFTYPQQERDGILGGSAISVNTPVQHTKFSMKSSIWGMRVSLD